MLLTAAERRRFAEWLRQEIRSNTALKEQMEKLSVSETMVKVKTVEIMAQTVVLRILAGSETQTVGG